MARKKEIEFIMGLQNLIQGSRKKKIAHKLDYWKSRKTTEGILSYNHYKYFYTTHFGFNETFLTVRKYQTQAVLRDSLEWAEMTFERVGLDPFLVRSYCKLGINAHRMMYVNARAEKIPFSDGYFDVVCSFNSLDHVDDLV